MSRRKGQVYLTMVYEPRKWAAYAKLVRDHAVDPQILLDRFHIVKHLNKAVDGLRRDLWRQLTTNQRVSFKGEPAGCC